MAVAVGDAPARRSNAREDRMWRQAPNPPRMGHDKTAQGQRPGSGEVKQRRALQGRDGHRCVQALSRPYRAALRLLTSNLGRCPRLSCDALSGRRTGGRDITGIHCRLARVIRTCLIVRSNVSEGEANPPCSPAGQQAFAGIVVETMLPQGRCHLPSCGTAIVEPKVFESQTRCKDPLRHKPRHGARDEIELVPNVVQAMHYFGITVSGIRGVQGPGMPMRMSPRHVCATVTPN